MKSTNKIIILFCLLSVLLSSCGSSDLHLATGNMRMRLGDVPEWASKDFDDSDWKWSEEVEGKGVFWIRIYIEFPEEIKTLEEVGILVGATGAYEAFWDGQLIGKNGQMKTEDKEEIPGTYHGFFSLPDSLSHSGDHLLALRLTKEYQNPPPHAFMIVGAYDDLLREPLQVSQFMFLLAGTFLITAIYFFFAFASQPKEYSLLIFGIICLTFFALLLMEYLKLYYLYPYPFQEIRLEIIGALHLLLSILIPVFFLIQFSFPWKKIFLLGLFLTLVYLEWEFHFAFDTNAWKHVLLMWGSSFAIVVYACVQKKKGAYVVLTGFLLGFLVVYFMPYFRFHYVSPYDVSLFISFVLLVLSMLYVLTLNQREEKRAYEASLVLSERLKNELLKKNIKPHFIMNTLTSLIDWVEESPKEGVQFIHALADEFEVLNQIADYQQVPIGQEIKLCKSHLKVMGYRKELSYEWKEEGIDPNDIIPPAIIHTAVENGVTHSLPDENGQIVFKLIFERKDDFKKYTLQTIAKNRNSTSKDQAAAEGGTGLKYIKARLQESYQDRWILNSAANANGWATTIQIFDR